MADTEQHAATSQRLGAVALTMALALVLQRGIFIFGLEALDWSPLPLEVVGHRFPLIDVFSAISFLVFGLCRLLRPREDRALKLGRAYQLVGAAFFAYTLVFHGESPTELLRPGFVHWLAIWIILFPVIVTAGPARDFAFGLIAALMPYGLLVIRVLADREELPPVQDIYRAYSAYPVCAVISIAPAYFIERIRRRADAARAELRELGSYRLTERIGAGGMGEVWRAEHRFLARPAAIKLIAREALVGPGEERREALARFEREARATSSLRSPNTVSVYDFGSTEDGSFFCVMELLDGLDLEDLVAEHGALPPERVVPLLIQACQSLAEAHERGFVHRDIKPGNLFLCRRGIDFDVLKILDFGLVAQRKIPYTEKLTAHGAIVGTPAFMAPEQVRGLDLTGATDLYALGCVAYWLLTESLIFEGDNAMSILVEHVQTRPTPLKQKTSKRLPEGLEELVMACLEKEPEARPSSALELAEALEGLAIEDPWTRERARAWWAGVKPQRGALAEPGLLRPQRSR